MKHLTSIVVVIVLVVIVVIVAIVAIVGIVVVIFSVIGKLGSIFLFLQQPAQFYSFVYAFQIRFVDLNYKYFHCQSNTEHEIMLAHGTRGYLLQFIPLRYEPGNALENGVI